MFEFRTLNGYSKNVNLAKYKIQWDGKSLSKFQREIKQFLKKYWIGHIVFEEVPVVGTRLKIDIYNASKRLAIECDGAQHTEYNKFFHNGDKLNFLKQYERDSRKLSWCELNDITLINIYPTDLPLNKSFFVKKFGINL